MKINVFSLFILFLLWIPALTIGSEGNNMEKHHALNQRQQSIIPIAGLPPMAISTVLNRH